MKLNIHVLFDELRDWAPQRVADEDIALGLIGIRALPEDERSLSTDYVYLATPAQLRLCKGGPARLNVICLGDIEESSLQAQRWNVLVLPDTVDARTVFETVQGVFEAHDRWSDSLTEVILQKEPIQRVLDLGAHPLWNPIALFDTSYCLIAKAGALPEHLAGTIWEVVLSKGYAPIETLPYEERAGAYERVRRNREPFFVHPPKPLTDHMHLIVSVFHDGSLFGVLAGSDINRPFSLGQVSLVNDLKNRIELFLKNNSELVNVNEATTYFMDRVLQGFSIEPGVVSYHLQKRGWSLQGHYRLFLFSDGVPHAKDLQADRHVMFRIGQSFPQAMIFPYENGIVAIQNNAGADDGPLVLTALELLLQELDLRAGLSLTFPSFMDLKYAYIQSKAALQEGTQQAAKGPLFAFQSTFTDHVVHSLAEVTSLKSLCEPRVLQLALQGGKNARRAIRSLRQYLFNGRNVSTTAALLNIHRNTLMDRLRQMEDLLGLDLKDLDEPAFFSLYLTCWITEYL